jgi:hypothetical protein
MYRAKPSTATFRVGRRGRKSSTWCRIALAECTHGLWQIRGADSSNTWWWFCMLTGHPEWADDANRDCWYRSTIVALDAIAAGYGDHWTGWRLA